MGMPQPGPGEAMWTQSDRDIVEGWLAWQDLLCDGCNLPRDEVWTRAEDYRWKGELRKCRACEAIDEAMQAHLATRSDDVEPDTKGIKVVAERGDVPERFQKMAGVIDGGPDRKSPPRSGRPGLQGFDDPGRSHHP